MKGLTYFFFRETVESGSGFVENNYLRILDKDFCDGKTLSLSSGEPYSTLSNLRIESIPEFVYEIAFCLLDCISELGIGYIMPRSI